jgi:hypothetical protein
MEEFPAVGRIGILYLYDGQFYLWDEENSTYFQVSVPLWNEEEPDFSSLTGIEGRFYTDNQDIYR